jgi:hypothetical protein
VELGLVVHPADVREISLDLVELEFPRLDLVDVEVEILESRDELLAEPIGVRIHGKIRKLFDGGVVVGSDERALVDVADDHIEGLGLGLLVLQLVVVRRVVDRKQLGNIFCEIHKQFIVLLQRKNPSTKFFKFLVNRIRFSSLRHDIVGVQISKIKKVGVKSASRRKFYTKLLKVVAIFFVNLPLVVLMDPISFFQDQCQFYTNTSIRKSAVPTHALANPSLHFKITCKQNFTHK